MLVSPCELVNRIRYYLAVQVFSRCSVPNTADMKVISYNSLLPSSSTGEYALKHRTFWVTSAIEIRTEIHRRMQDIVRLLFKFHMESLMKENRGVQVSRRDVLLSFPPFSASVPLSVRIWKSKARKLGDVQPSYVLPVRVSATSSHSGKTTESFDETVFPLPWGTRSAFLILVDATGEGLK